MTLLPGAIVAAATSDIVKKAIPGVESVAFWGALICLDFLWYFGISLAAIKVYRFISNAAKKS